MSESRKKSDSILLRTGGKIHSLELFPSGEWPEENGPDDAFRVRIDDVWYCPVGKYSFLTRAAIGELVANLLGGDELPEEKPAPFLPYKSDVWVHTLDAPHRVRGTVRVDPYQKRDGNW